MKLEELMVYREDYRVFCYDWAEKTFVHAGDFKTREETEKVSKPLFKKNQATYVYRKGKFLDPANLIGSE